MGRFRLFGAVGAVMSALVLAACGPVIETHYDFKPPVSDAGMQCVQSCQQAKTWCRQEARDAEEKCRKKQDRKAERDYEKAMDDYIVALKLRAADPAKYPEPTEPKRRTPSYYMCRADTSQCQPDFNQCYSACGGKVTSRQVCVANCDQ